MQKFVTHKCIHKNHKSHVQNSDVLRMCVWSVTKLNKMYFSDLYVRGFDHNVKRQEHIFKTVIMYSDQTLYSYLYLSDG